MSDLHGDLPLPFRLANGLGRLLGAAGINLAPLDEEALEGAAIKETGLHDFGNPYYQEGLRRLLRSLREDAGLSPAGQFVAHNYIVRQLANRLQLVEATRRQPEIFNAKLRPPLIVLGLARSGTTFLHRMLALDPAHRALPFWELARPLPPQRGPDRRRLQARVEDLVRAWFTGNSVDHIHYIRSDLPEEDMWMLGLTFHNMAYWVLFPVYGYAEWYIGQERGQKYADYRRLLQILQARAPQQRLTLKAPEHSGSVAALLSHVPNPLLVQTHRDPTTAVTSLNSLISNVQRLMTPALDVERTAAVNLQLVEAEMRRNLRAREKHPGAIFDVAYEELTADPLGTVKAIYEHYDLPWTPAYEGRLYAYIETHPKGCHGRHRYSPADFGQDEAELARRFRAYSVYSE